MANKPITLLLIAAHPADCFDQAGGTLAHHAAQGDRVVAVTVSTGVRTHHWELLDERMKNQEDADIESQQTAAVEKKLEETRAACRILGFDEVRTLGFGDDEQLLTQELLDAIANVIREVRPDIIITHHPYEMGGFKLHGTVGQATIYAWNMARGTGRGDQPTHHASCLYFMNPMAYMGQNTLGYASGSHITNLVDITDVIDKKVQAMDLISSQYYGGAYARKCHEAGDGRTGQHGHVAYAESFQSFFPRTSYTLPISDADLHRQTEPMAEYVARRSEMVAGLMPLPDGQGITSKYRLTKEEYDA